VAPPLTAAARAGLAVALVALAGGALSLNGHLVGVFYDDGVYAALGWALAHGQGYVYPNLPGTPPAVHFPPLYPLVLAPWFGLLSVPAAALAAKVLNVGFAAAASGLVAWHAARTQLIGAGAPPWLAPALVAAAALAIPCLTVLTVLLSEPLFSLLFATAVILADRPPVRISSAGAACLAGVAAALALLVRSIGVSVGIGVLVSVVSAGRGATGAALRRRVALAALPLAVAVVGWGMWVLTYEARIDPLLGPDYGSYFAFLRAAGGTVLGGSTVDLGRPFGVLTLGWVPSPSVYYLWGVPALGVGLYGVWCLVRIASVGPALLAYLAILACWPVPPDRFLWAILPWLALAWTRGAVELWSQQKLRVPLAVLSVGLAFGYGRYEMRGFAGRLWDVAARRTSDDFTMLLPALDSLPPDAVIATDYDPLVWLYTRRRAVPLDVYGPPPPVYRAYLERQGVTHVLVALGERAAQQQVESMSQAYPGLLSPTRRWSGRTLFEVRRVGR